jgi:A/G-specific adenine glycosylase
MTFQQTVWEYYRAHRRPFLWRRTKNPYRIVVSEIMLQQTQTERVRTKYKEFLQVFPTVHALAAAPLSQVLKVWQGMGYSRRAIALKKLAEQVCAEHKGKIPSSPAELLELPGIGPYTAAAVGTFAFNQSNVFIETNIRTVFTHFFFPNKKQVMDAELMPLIEQHLDRTNPREWYYALMDYGVYLKKLHPRMNARSAHYHKQTKFEGSRRQVRGAILKALVANPTGRTMRQLTSAIKDLKAKDTLTANLQDLIKEGFIVKKTGRYSLKNA